MIPTYTCLLTANVQGKELSIPAYWAINPCSPQRHCRTLDLVVNWRPDLNTTRGSFLGSDKSDDHQLAPIHLDNASPWCKFIIDNLQHLKSHGGENDVIAIKFILSDQSGFCARSDFLQWRFAGFEAVIVVQGFPKPRQEIARAILPDSGSSNATVLPQILHNAVGAMIVRDIDALVETEAELDNRLSFPWISPSCPPLKRIAWVRGRYNMDHSERIWESASALGIAVVIIDQEGHWLQDRQWDHIREGFIATNLDPDDGFVDRLVSAVRGYGKPIHGITTVSNKRMVGVARACERLGLPTSPSESFVIAADKYRSREIEPDSGVTAFRVLGVEDLKDRLSSSEQPPIQYPVVVKPCIGWGSECISKVHTENELVQAVEKASERHRTSPIQRTDVMIETYIDGPEIDANIILLGGEIIFFEVADDFPSTADYTHNKWQDSFQETLMVFPSHLPQDEIDMIRQSLHGTLLRQGFRDGVFNCEGRVRNSRMRYTVRNGEEDLFEGEQDDMEHKTPSFYLHEINARPPGYYGNVACNLTYGVDYYALDMLCAVGDMERFRSLAHTFMRGPQWWLVITMIPEVKEGVMKTGDACGEFLQKFRDLNAAVPGYMTWKKGGSKLQGPNASQLSFVGHFYVMSRTSRKEVLRLVSRIKREFSYELE
ncbi:glutathione synthetase ATP-binding domain-like protein [Hypomontagnella monticulosa]|nr:glutathione synthetase ATP-binding domain-like protein [Hypomontagnella monticulosa]